MKLPGERFGNLFTRLRYDSPFHLTSILGGLSLNVQATNKGFVCFGAPTQYNTNDNNYWS